MLHIVFYTCSIVADICICDFQITSFSSCCFYCGIQPEQTADWGEGSYTLQRLPAKCQTLCGWEDQHGCAYICSHYFVVLGLGRHQCQPRLHCTGRVGTFWLCPLIREGQHDNHGGAVDPVSVCSECRTAVVSNSTHTHTA